MESWQELRGDDLQDGDTADMRETAVLGSLQDLSQGHAFADQAMLAGVELAWRFTQFACHESVQFATDAAVGMPPGTEGRPIRGL